MTSIQQTRFLRVRRASDKWGSRLATVLAFALLTAMLSAVRSGAAEQSISPELSLRYRFIDLGTLGGPNSSETQEFPFINNRGTVVGFADTAIPDDGAEGFVFHAFRWREGALRDLGTLAGGVNSFAIWSNDADDVVGGSETSKVDPLTGTPQSRGVLWRNEGRTVDLGTLGGNQSLAVDINDRAQIAGVAANRKPDPFSMFGWGTQTRAFLWENGTMRDLGTLGGPDAGAFFVNERGQAAGASYTNSTSNSGTGIPTQDPFLWTNGTMVDLGTLGGTLGFATALNNRGQVVGQSNLAGDETAHPFLWDRGKLQDLGTLGGTFGVANWLNDAGEVAGGATTSADDAFHAFFWRKGVMTDLGTIHGDSCSVAHFMNAEGQVVGTSGDCGGQFEKHGFISKQGAPMIDLNSFVPASSNLTVTDGETINDRGEIAGSGMLPNGDFHAVVLLPCTGNHAYDKGCHAARPIEGSALSSPSRNAVARSSGAFRDWASTEMRPRWWRAPASR